MSDDKLNSRRLSVTAETIARRKARRSRLLAIETLQNGTHGRASELKRLSGLDRHFGLARELSRRAATGPASAHRPFVKQNVVTIKIDSRNPEAAPQIALSKISKPKPVVPSVPIAIESEAPEVHRDIITIKIDSARRLSGVEPAGAPAVSARQQLRELWANRPPMPTITVPSLRMPTPSWFGIGEAEEDRAMALPRVEVDTDTKSDSLLERLKAIDETDLPAEPVLSISTDEPQTELPKTDDASDIAFSEIWRKRARRLAVHAKRGSLRAQDRLRPALAVTTAALVRLHRAKLPSRAVRNVQNGVERALSRAPTYAARLRGAMPDFAPLKTALFTQAGRPLEAARNVKLPKPALPKPTLPKPTTPLSGVLQRKWSIAKWPGLPSFGLKSRLDDYIVAQREKVRAQKPRQVAQTDMSPWRLFEWRRPATEWQPDGPRLKSTWKPRIPFLSPALSLSVIAGAGLLAFTVKSDISPAELYPIEKTLAPRAERQLILFAQDGKKFARRGGCVDAPVARSELPQHFVDALLAMEDRRFYKHIGIDPIGIARAARRNYQAGRVVEGGSTLTQQLAKLVYLSSQRTYDRKLQELLAVMRLELLLTKDQILERYLNSAYFGQGCHGLRAAARHYFKKQVRDLTVAESAVLVALLRSPSRLIQDREKAWARQKLVLQAMVETGTLKKTELASLTPAKFQDVTPSVFGAYYADWVAETADVPRDGDHRPLKVKTSFDPQLQRIAEQSIKDVLDGKWARRLKANQTALVAMRTDGRVVAMVGGRDYRKSQFNRAFQAKRQPGSSFKTFVYLAALRHGAYPHMRVYDEPITIGEWSPENFGHKYRGPVSLKQAFTSSINTVAVRVSEAVGRDNVINVAYDLGVKSKIISTPSIALGTAEVSLVELTSAYAAIAADAYPVRPWSILALDNGNPKAAKPPKGAGQWKLRNGKQMRELLSSVVQYGTARGARLPIPAYGKTGTSQEFRDAWFVGFAGNLVVGVWVGNDDFKPMRGVTGGSLPARIWQRFMSRARAKDPRFKSRLQRVAAFPAKHKAAPRRNVAALNALRESDSTVVASGRNGFWYEGDRVMLIGPGRYGRIERYNGRSPNRYRARRRRNMPTFNDFGN